MNSPDQDHPNVIAMPPLIFAACLGVGLGLHWLFPISLPSWLPRKALGTVFLVCSAAIAFSAFRVMHKANTSIRPDRPSTNIVTTGPFRFTRNPLYLSFCLLNAGIALLVNGLLPLLMTVVFTAILRQGVIVREEKYLAAKFGPAYVDYCSRVRRWF